MKNLYYRFLLFLLNKPFLQIIISIFCILIIRIIFITIVCAESYVEDSSAELLLEEYLKSRDDVFMTKEEEIRHVKTISEKVISDAKAQTIYELANPDIKIDGNAMSEEIQKHLSAQQFTQEFLGIIREYQNQQEAQQEEAQQEEAQDETQEVFVPENIPNHLDYQEILFQIDDIANNVDDKSELIKQILTYVDQQIPHTIFPIDKEDVRNMESTFNQYMRELYQNHAVETEIERICDLLFVTAIVTHGLAINNEELLTLAEVEKFFLDILPMPEDLSPLKNIYINIK
jgi:hypothetical protein